MDQIPAERESPHRVINRLPGEKALSVTARLIHNEQMQIIMGTHSMVADHATKHGGDGLGPAPGEIFLGALASCAVAYIVRHAKWKKFPVESVEVNVTAELGYDKIDGPIHVQKYLTRIERNIQIRGPLTEAQFQELKFAAEHCVLSESVRRGVPIEEQFTFSGPG